MVNPAEATMQVLRRERYDSLPTTSPWDDSLPVGAEYARHPFHRIDTSRYPGSDVRYD
jgi:hypothetical protein